MFWNLEGKWFCLTFNKPGPFGFGPSGTPAQLQRRGCVLLIRDAGYESKERGC